MRLFAFAAALGLLFSLGCDTGIYVECPGGVDCFETPFDPDTVDFDAVSVIDYAQYVRPLLAARNALSFVPTEGPAPLAFATYEAVTAAGPSGLIVPFDADESLLIRLATETLAPGSEDPYPNLRTLQDDEVRYLRRWIEAGAKNSGATAPAYANARVLLYVCNQLAGRVSIVDAERGRIIRNVYFEDLGEPADARPHHVVVEPDGSAWYVALISGSDGGSVLKLSSDLTVDPGTSGYLLASETPTGSEPTFQKPGMLALDATRQRLFAGRSFSADASSSGLGRFDTGVLSFDLVPTPDVHPHALGLSRDGAYVFTAALTSEGGSTAAYVLDAASGDLVDQELVPGALAFVHYAVSPDGETVVLTSQTGAALYVFDFDTASGDLSLRGSVPTGDQPWHPVFSPDGSTVYVPNRLSNTITAVDPDDLRVMRSYGGNDLPFSQPHGTALTGDGATLFVSSRNFQMGAPDAATWTPPIRFLAADGTPEPIDLYGNVVAMDTETDAALAVIPTGRWASGLALYDPR